MRLMHLARREEVEARFLDEATVLIRGCLGGLSPTLLDPWTLYTQALILPERREAAIPRRMGPCDRRRNRRRDRRQAGLYIGQTGRRRSDALSWADDEAVARGLDYIRRRTSGETPAA